MTNFALQVDRIWPVFIFFSHDRRYILVTRYHNLILIGGAGTNLFVDTFLEAFKKSTPWSIGHGCRKIYDLGNGPHSKLER
jgi:hypothetical protein